MIFVGMILIPTLNSLYSYLKERNIDVEARPLGFNRPRTILKDKQKILKAYEKLRENELKRNLKAGKKAEKDNSDQEPPKQETSEHPQCPYAMPANQSPALPVPVYKPDVIAIYQESVDEMAEIISVESDNTTTVAEEKKVSDEKNEQSSSDEKKETISPNKEITEEIHLAEHIINAKETNEVPNNSFPEKEENTNESIGSSVTPAKKRGLIGGILNSLGIASRKTDANTDAKFINAHESSLQTNTDELFTPETSDLKPRDRKAEEQGLNSEQLAQIQSFEYKASMISTFLANYLKEEQLPNKDFFVMINRIHGSKDLDVFKKNIKIELPKYDFSKVTETEFVEFKEHASTIVEATNTFNMGGV